MTLEYQASLFDSFDSFDAEADAGPAAGSLVPEMRRIDLENGAWIDLRPSWISNSDALFESLVTDVPWKADRREMYDRIVDVPRLVSWFGPSQRLPHPVLTRARSVLNAHYAASGPQELTTAGLCFYRTGTDSVAWHGDRMGAASGQDTRVAILSVGAERVLSVRPRGGGEITRFPLGHGDLIVMGGSCQRSYEHAILKTARAVGPRISVQFRPAWSRGGGA